MWCILLSAGHCRTSSEKDDFLITTMVGALSWIIVISDVFVTLNMCLSSLVEKRCPLDSAAKWQAESSDSSLLATLQLWAVELGPLTRPQGGQERSAPPAHATTEEAEQQWKLRYCESFWVLDREGFSSGRRRRNLSLCRSFSLLYGTDIHQPCGQQVH